MLAVGLVLELALVWALVPALESVSVLASVLVSGELRQHSEACSAFPVHDNLG